MALWNKLFGERQKNGGSADDTPDNTRLMELINKYASTRNYDDYMKAYQELETGRAFLLLPSNGETSAQTGWRKTAEGETLKLTSVFEMDGLRVLGAFTDEAALLSWSKTRTPYVAMPSKSVLEICYSDGIGRIVINTGLDNMFVLERDSKAFNSTKLEADTLIREGVPERPLRKEVLQRIARGFEGLGVVQRAFHYGRELKGSFSLVVGVKLLHDSENARKAVKLAIHDVLKTETLDQPFDIYFIEKEEPLKAISSIQDALFFQSSNTN
jgi:hypothetical protein